MRLTCAVCGDVSKELPEMVDGQPLMEWFERRGERCKDCFTQPHKLPPPPNPKSIDSRFKHFHVTNPWVFDSLVNLARELVAEGQQRLGIRMLWEVARWQRIRATKDASSDYKLNDHYHSRYVRLIQATCPDLADAFETRKLRAD